MNLQTSHLGTYPGDVGIWSMEARKDESSGLSALDEVVVFALCSENDDSGATH